jgi:hypothetical protein
MKTYLLFFISLFLYVTSFSQNIKESDVPSVVQDAFKQKLPEATASSWKIDSSMYIVTFNTTQNQKGIAKFAGDGTWHYTKYSIPDKELPGPVLSDIKQNYKDYKIKSSEMILEPGTDNYYYLIIKKEGISQPAVELFYTLAGKLIKKNILKGKDNKIDFDNNGKIDSTDVIKNTGTTETIDKKELPSPILSYIKQNYVGFIIKEAVSVTTNNVLNYHITVKKEGKKETHELIFNLNGKFLSITPEEEP